MKSTTSSGPQPAQVSVSELRRVVDLARCAPSVDNTQPWTWRLDPAGLDLWADPSRGLPLADPLGRDLVISCGAALHHALVAAESLGLGAEVVRQPDDSTPDLLATIRFFPTVVPPNSAEIRRSIQERHTDRRRFTEWPVPEARVEGLAVAAQAWDASGVTLVDPDLRQHIALLAERAGRSRLGGRRLDANQNFWPSDGLLAICTAYDDASSWLAAGVALSAMWLQATREGLSVVPLCRVVEVPSTRRALEDALAIPGVHVQALVRLGWQPIGRDASGRTPRRSLDDVLREGTP